MVRIKNLIIVKNDFREPFIDWRYFAEPQYAEPQAAQAPYENW